MKSKLPISLCMIVKDEEKHIERCLRSVESFVSEIIVVDTGSTDHTIQICESFGANVIQAKWNNHFADVRNKGIDYAKEQWILWLDADEEWVGSEEELEKLVHTTEASVLSIPVVNYHGEGEPINPEDAFIMYQYRLFRNAKGIRFVNAIHELLQLNKDHVIKTITASTIAIKHYGYLKENVNEKQKSSRNIELLLKEVEKTSSNPWIYYHLASEYASLQKFREAFYTINQAILQFIEADKKPPSIFYRLKYGILIETNNIEGAWPAIEKAILLYPDYVDLQFYKGYILFKLEEYEQSIKSFERCIEMGETHDEHLILKGTGSFRALYYKGQCLKALGKLDEANEVLNKAEMMKTGI